MNISKKFLFFPALVVLLFWGCSGKEDSRIRIMETTGPMAVGTVRYSFTDAGRQELFTPDTTDRREVAVKIWYPAYPETCVRRAPYIESAADRKRRTPENSALTPEFFDRMDGVMSNSFYGAEVMDEGAPYPVIIFSHAYGAGMTANTVLLEELASHGYVTVSVGHAFETTHFIRDDGSLKVFSFDNEEFMSRAKERGESYALQRKINETGDSEELESVIRELMKRRPGTIESLKAWTGDISFVLDRLEKMNASGGKFGGKLDLDRIGAIGHSFGGTASGEVCVVDERVKAGVNLDGLQIGSMLDSHINKPFMFMHHDNEGVLNKRPNKIFFERAEAPAYMILIKGTSHFNFSDLSMPFYSEILRPPDGYIGSIDGYRCLKIQNDYVRAFFDKHLQGIDSGLLDGPSKDYPEVEIEVR